MEELCEPDVFSVVNQMYCAYRAINPQVHRTWYINGELAECPLDYCLSVDLAVKRSALTLRERVLWSRFSQESAEAVARLLPSDAKAKLAEAWKPIYWGYHSLRKRSEHGSAMERAKQLRQAKALDDGAFALYAEEREAIEILQTQEETNSEVA